MKVFGLILFLFGILLRHGNLKVIIYSEGEDIVLKKEFFKTNKKELRIE